MRYIFVFTLFLLLLAEAYSSFYPIKNYQKAFNEASQTQKMLMLIIVQDECGWCKKLTKETLKSTQIENVISQRFIPILLNKDRDFIPTKYQTTAIPTIFFINTQEDEEVWRSVGYHDVKRMLKIFDKALESFKQDVADEAIQ